MEPDETQQARTNNEIEIGKMKLLIRSASSCLFRGSSYLSAALRVLCGE